MIKGGQVMTVENGANGADNGESLCKYYIDLDWYREQERSFVLLATSRLCPSSQKKKIPKSDTALMNTLKQCCSKSEQYITLDMTLTESIFRLLLANGNNPMSLEQMQTKLLQHAGDVTGSRDISIPKLKLVIDNDRYYGMTSIELDDEEDLNSSPQND
jgi:hypothetical protein